MRKFQCKHCEMTQIVTLWERIKHPHLFGVRLYMKCPKCGKRNWHRRVK